MRFPDVVTTTITRLVDFAQGRETSVQKLEIGPPVRPFLSAPEHHGDVVLRSRDSCLQYGGWGGGREEYAPASCLSFRSFLPQTSMPTTTRKVFMHCFMDCSFLIGQFF